MVLGCSDSGTVSPNAVEEIESPEVPQSYSLSQNYPNPFNPETRIEFALPRASFVTIEIYNILGARIKTLVPERLSSGFKAVTWYGMDENVQPVPSGVYFYKFEADSFIEAKKMLFLK